MRLKTTLPFLLIFLISFFSRSFAQDVFDVGIRTIEIFFSDTGSPALIKDPVDKESIFVIMPMKA